MARLAEAAGPDVGRIGTVVELLEAHHPDHPHYYLNLLGVDPARHGGGLGSALLAAGTHRCDVERQPAYLEATNPRNRRLYERHGFEVFGEVMLPDGPSMWPMWRRPQR